MRLSVILLQLKLIYSKLPFDQHNYSMGLFTPGVAVTRTRRFTIQSIVYTVSLYYDGDCTFKTWIDNHPLNSQQIYFFFELTQTSTAPAFELGGGKATGGYALAEGYNTIASGNYSHAEGLKTQATSYYTHAEGELSIASRWWAHAEGYSTEATNFACHAEGYDSIASGENSHAEGNCTIASGAWSHAQNANTVATEPFQTVIGKYNAATVNWSDANLNYTYTNVGNYAFIIGNGTNNTTADRSNAFTVDWNGNVISSGNITDGSGNVLNSISTGIFSLDVNASASASTDATSGEDMDLFNNIRTLGWYSDVIV